MNEQLMIAIVAIVIAAVVVATVAYFITRRSEHLRRRFGPEFERTGRDTDDVRRGDDTLQARETRVTRVQIKPLTPDEAKRFSDEWQQVQSRFMDEPAGAVAQADRLVGDIMAARGYPVGDFERRVDDISVDHPNVVMNYRAARTIAEEHARHPVSTEDMRQAMVHYRALFRELIEDTTSTTIVEREVAPPVGAIRDRRERP